jgi:hypothetical protein
MSKYKYVVFCAVSREEGSMTYLECVVERDKPLNTVEQRDNLRAAMQKAPWAKDAKVAITGIHRIEETEK